MPPFRWGQKSTSVDGYVMGKCDIHVTRLFNAVDGF